MKYFLKYFFEIEPLSLKYPRWALGPYVIQLIKSSQVEIIT